MRPLLTELERKNLDERVTEAEKRTDAQIVLAFTRRSDVYAELPWKAFALGAGLAGLVTTLLDLLRPSWPGSHTILLTTTAILAAGALCALLCVLVPRFGRIFLETHRAETEVRQYAESLFLSRQIFATAKRTGVLLVVSLFEHRAVIIPDIGLKARLPLDAQNRIIARLREPLAACRVGSALEQGLAALEDALGAGTAVAPGKDELSNAVVEGEEA